MRGHAARIRLRPQAAAMASLLAGLAVLASAGPQHPSAPPHAAERLGPWGVWVAIYDPALFGPERPLADLIAQYRLRLRDGRLRGARLLANKAQRRLELWVGKRMVKAYRIQLGLSPHGPKTRRGDMRTPEGAYYICAHRPSIYDLALWISYPNAGDAKRGLREGVITRAQFDAIVSALERRVCPPQDTGLGGDILIHGQLPEYTSRLAKEQREHPGTLPKGFRPGDAVPAKITEFEDWTDGCIALFNPCIRELYEYIADGTPLTIVANGPVTAPR